MSKSAITLSRITKSFGATQVLKEISLDVSPGEVLVLIGASGSGKSTVLRIMSGLETADGGEIWVNEVPLHDRKRSSEICGHVGMVFQQFNLFPHRTVLQNIVDAPMRVKKQSRQQATSKALSLLKQVGLAGREEEWPQNLSGGQQQRVAIARALAMDPGVMLFDEPTSALDPELVGEVLQVIKQLAHSGITMVIVTHEIGFAREVADNIVFMEGGRIVAAGPTQQVLDDPENGRVRNFIATVL